jgi:hypothetical protein
MKDILNRIFAFLAKVHAVTYILLGGTLLALFFILYIDELDFDWIKRAGLLGIISIGASYFFSRKFYEKYEFGQKYLPQSNSGLITKDSYFYFKINSDIAI